MKILVTAGPTREAIDPVRFISNRSSGKMGYAIACSAARRGHDVLLISGPVCLRPPRGIRVVKVVTAEQMALAVKRNVTWCDILIMTAAVCDWRPVRVASKKMKKTSVRIITLKLKPTIDILRSIRKLKGKRIFVGFAAETDNLIEYAKSKLKSKRLDMVVANDVSRNDAGFESDLNKVTFLMSDGRIEELPIMPKKKIAELILDRVEYLLNQRQIH